MPMLGQASGGWTESSSALRLLHVGVRNTTGILTDDSFTQANPPAVATANTISTRINQRAFGVLSGSVCFTRPDGGSNFVGGASSNAVQAAIAALAATQGQHFRALGCFINQATGNEYENIPGQASGKGPYVSAQGTYGNAIYETNLIANTADVPNSPATRAITYVNGMLLVGSRNGYLMPTQSIGADGNLDATDLIAITAESFVQNANTRATTIGLVKMPPDATQTEVVYDQRI